MHINGTVHLPPEQLRYDAWFSRYALVWGWASWANAWQKYDSLLLNYPMDRLNQVFTDSEKSRRWRELLTNIQQNQAGFGKAGQDFVLPAEESAGAILDPFSHLDDALVL